MFDLNPHGLADAQLQHWLMLFVAGTLGFIIGYVMRQDTMWQLEDDLAGLERDVNDCHRIPVSKPSSDETSVLNRIRARARELDFDRIGRATPAEADDLKAIVGVGPFLEKKLHAIGIYTFRQIARFNDDDVQLVNDIIEFFSRPYQTRQLGWSVGRICPAAIATTGQLPAKINSPYPINRIN